jgi:hypothetical protein
MECKYRANSEMSKRGHGALIRVLVLLLKSTVGVYV